MRLWLVSALLGRILVLARFLLGCILVLVCGVAEAMLMLLQHTGTWARTGWMTRLAQVCWAPKVWPVRFFSTPKSFFGNQPDQKYPWFQKNNILNPAHLCRSCSSCVSNDYSKISNNLDNLSYRSDTFIAWRMHDGSAWEPVTDVLLSEEKWWLLGLRSIARSWLSQYISAECLTLCCIMYR